MSRVRRDIFTRLLVVRASCASLLQRDLGVPQASVYRELNVLMDLGLVERVLPHREGVGRPYSIYAIKGHVPDDIVEASERASRLRIPAYSSV